MTKQSGGATGKVRAKADGPPPDESDRGETSSADDPAPVDLDTAHDRAS